jgi:hypothetical protein
MAARPRQAKASNVCRLRTVAALVIARPRPKLKPQHPNLPLNHARCATKPTSSPPGLRWPWPVARTPDPLNSQSNPSGACHIDSCASACSNHPLPAPWWRCSITSSTYIRTLLVSGHGSSEVAEMMAGSLQSCTPSCSFTMSQGLGFPARWIGRHFWKPTSLPYLPLVWPP